MHELIDKARKSMEFLFKSCLINTTLKTNDEKRKYDFD